MQRPVPTPTPETREFWQGVERGVLMFQRCGKCGLVQSYPRAYCTQCHSQELDWHQSSGQATVCSYTTVYRAATPAFRDDVPYVIALLDVEEGFRVMVNVRAPHIAGLRIGAPATIRCGDRGDGVILLLGETA